MILIEPFLISVLNRDVPLIGRWAAGIGSYYQLSRDSLGLVEASVTPLTVKGRGGRWIVDVTVFDHDHEMAMARSGQALDVLKSACDRGELGEAVGWSVVSLPHIVSNPSSSKRHLAVAFTMEFVGHYG